MTKFPVLLFFRLHCFLSIWNFVIQFRGINLGSWVAELPLSLLKCLKHFLYVGPSVPLQTVSFACLPFALRHSCLQVAIFLHISNFPRSYLPIFKLTPYCRRLPRVRSRFWWRCVTNAYVMSMQIEVGGRGNKLGLSVAWTKADGHDRHVTFFTASFLRFHTWHAFQGDAWGPICYTAQPPTFPWQNIYSTAIMNCEYELRLTLLGCAGSSTAPCQ